VNSILETLERSPVDLDQKVYIVLVFYLI